MLIASPVLRGDHRVDPLDGHALLCRLKVAVALMALDGRTEIHEDDRHLAGHVMDVSVLTREQCRRALTEHRRIENTARALAAVERDEIVAERKSQRAREAIVRKLSRDRQLTTRELRRSLKVDIRDYYDAALAGCSTPVKSSFRQEYAEQKGTRVPPVHLRKTPRYL